MHRFVPGQRWEKKGCETTDLLTRVWFSPSLPAFDKRSNKFQLMPIAVYFEKVYLPLSRVVSDGVPTFDHRASFSRASSHFFCTFSRLVIFFAGHSFGNWNKRRRKSMWAETLRLINSLLSFRRLIRQLCFNPYMRHLIYEQVKSDIFKQDQIPSKMIVNQLGYHWLTKALIFCTCLTKTGKLSIKKQWNRLILLQSIIMLLIIFKNVLYIFSTLSESCGSRKSYWQQFTGARVAILLIFRPHSIHRAVQLLINGGNTCVEIAHARFFPLV